MNEIKSKIVHILVDQLALDEAELTDTARFYEDLAVDSLDYCEAIVAIEKALNITVDDEDMARLTTLGALVAYANKKAVHGHVLEVA